MPSPSRRVRWFAPFWLVLACHAVAPPSAPGAAAASGATGAPALVAAPGSSSAKSRTPTASGAPAPDAAPSDTLARRYAGARARSTFRGEASYYSDSLAGRSTASGEPYDPREFTGAHRRLPFGAVVRVTREDTGRSVYVRINDRGPFRRGRVVDLSRAAAEALEMTRVGVARVRVEVLEAGAPAH